MRLCMTGWRRCGLAAVAIGIAGTLGACSDGDGRTTQATPPPSTTSPAEHPTTHVMRSADRAAAQIATAAFQDVDTAETAGYASSLDTLGCFQDPARGGMGVHYINESLLDASVDIARPEALVYELDGHGAITGLVAHEYIVPVDAWTQTSPPKLVGVDFHRHPTLPLWVLHTWIWKDNADGVFADWNPAVRQCPTGVPIFGIDLPA